MTTVATPKSDLPSDFISVRPQWLAQLSEAAIEPDLPIIDPHHHLWLHGQEAYFLPELLADTDSGHRVIATVFVECRAMYRAGASLETRSLGETEFVNGVAAMSASGQECSDQSGEELVHVEILFQWVK
jgi:hypothetical protein